MWNKEIIKQRARKESKTLYISTACYSDNTKRILDDIYEQLDWSKKAVINSLNIDVFPKTIADMIMEEQKKIVDQYTRDMLCSVPKYTITPVGPDFTNKPRLKDLYFKYIQPYETNAVCKLELNNEKEKEKMNAKRCDRCGKLYIPTDDAPIRAYLCGRVTEHEKETYLPEKNKEFNTFNISIRLNNTGTDVDMCPECREKLKEFFESGEDEATGKLRKA